MMKEFMKKPITWGAYLKLCGVCAGVSAITCGIYAYKFNKMFNVTNENIHDIQDYKEKLK